VVATERQGVLIAKDALVTDEKGNFIVFVAKDNQAVRRAVKLGIETDKMVEILEGVQVGEKVIVVGQNGLKDGGKIAVQDATKQVAQL
jgi:hypothetical protein